MTRPILIAVCEDDALQLPYVCQAVREAMPTDELCRVFPYQSSAVLLADIEDGMLMPDIAVLDIQMEGLDGIELAKCVNRCLPRCRIVFMTSYLGYATDVYDTDHAYFVLKDEMRRRLPDALVKALSGRTERSYVLLRVRSVCTAIPAEDVLYLERTLHKTRVVTNTQKYDTTQLPAELLSEGNLMRQFIRCHQSYWVNVIAVSAQESGSFLLKNGERISFGRTYAKGAKAQFASLLSDKLP